MRFDDYQKQVLRNILALVTGTILGIIMLYTGVTIVYLYVFGAFNIFSPSNFNHMNLQAKYSTATFHPVRAFKTTSVGAKPGGYGPQTFIDGAPFGGSNGEPPKYPKKGKKK